MTIASQIAPGATTPVSRSSRLHHFNFVCRDVEETRAFYEDLLGFPLIAFYVEVENMPGVGEIVLGHAFYGLADGSSIAIMHFPNEAVSGPTLEVERELPDLIHLALHVTPEVQAEIKGRLNDAGVNLLEVDHGLVRSIYFRDPNGVTLELTVDPSNVVEVEAYARATAHDNMRRYVQGDHSEQKRSHADAVKAVFA